MSSPLEPEFIFRLICSAAERFDKITIFDARCAYLGAVKGFSDDKDFVYLSDVLISDKEEQRHAADVAIRIDTITAVSPIVVKRSRKKGSPGGNGDASSDV